MDSPLSITGENLEYVEQIYELFLKNPNSVSKEWKEYFETNDLNSESGSNPEAHRLAKAEVIEAAKKKSNRNESTSQPDSVKQVSVLQLINAYRFRGHRNANLDPLNQYKRPQVPELDPSFHDLFESDLDTVFNTGSLQGVENATLREILKIVRETYCENVGAEYMHIVETAEKRWIQQQLEPSKENLLTNERRKQLLRCIVAAGSLERYLHKKYVGQKRFSLEGGESTIALLDTVVEECGKHGIKECVVGMAHRGRLNVLVNIIGKHPSDLFDEFEGKGRPENLSGDVKYHLGYSSDIQTPSGPVHLTLAFNPSHLEIIDPVVEGSVRARQDRRRDSGRNEVLPLILHGDAAFAGQGVVMETFNLSQTRGYSTGGSLHVIINNQIGFTTSEPLDSRSTLYCTDVAKMIQAPIFHVNADDPDAVARVAKIALDFRMEFNKDVIIDLICFRKHGHSETDEPATTQPLMYKKIRSHPGTETIYADKLVSDGVLKEGEAAKIREQYIKALEDNQVVSRPYAELLDNSAVNYFLPFLGSNWESEYNSASVSYTHLTLPTKA